MVFLILVGVDHTSNTVEREHALEELANVDRYCHWAFGDRDHLWLSKQIAVERRHILDLGKAGSRTLPRRSPAAIRPTKACILYYSGLRYGTETEDPVTVTHREHRVLQAFLDCRSMDKRTLEKQSDCDEAVKVLRGLKTGNRGKPPRYGGIFCSAISLPGRPYAGGYTVKIRRAQ
jgi:hypothetical protein